MFIRPHQMDKINHTNEWIPVGFEPSTSCKSGQRLATWATASRSRVCTIGKSMWDEEVLDGMQDLYPLGRHTRVNKPVDWLNATHYLQITGSVFGKRKILTLGTMNEKLYTRLAETRTAGLVTRGCRPSGYKSHLPSRTSHPSLAITQNEIHSRLIFVHTGPLNLGWVGRPPYGLYVELGMRIHLATLFKRNLTVADTILLILIFENIGGIYEDISVTI